MTPAAFFPFDNECEAQNVTEIINLPKCLEFVAYFTFTDSKRPITVELPQRQNVCALAEDRFGL